jgi:autotransporter adhesin
MTNLSPGIDPTDAATVGQLGSVSNITGTASGDHALALGPTALAIGNNATAVGNQAQAIAPGALALGDGTRASGINSTAVGGGNVIASGANASAFGDQAMAMGDNSIAIGESSVVTVGATNGIAIGNGAQTSAQNAVALGSYSIADRYNTVSVGAPGAERAITNVAPALLGTDAVNLNQLNAVNNQLKTRIDQQVATALAMAQTVSMSTKPGECWLNGGVGTQSNQVGYALGLGCMNPKGNINYGVGFGGGINQKGVSIRAGVGIRLF